MTIYIFIFIFIEPGISGSQGKRPNHWAALPPLTSFRLPELQSSTGKMNDHLHFYFAIHAFYSNFLIAFLSFILPVEDCSSGSRKLVVLIILARDRFLNFNYVLPWLRPFNIFTNCFKFINTVRLSLVE